MSLLKQVLEEGYAVTEPLVPASSVDVLLDELQPRLATVAGQRGGLRLSLHQQGPVAGATVSNLLAPLAADLLGKAARPVRCLLFDKTPGANWKVVWHQDLTIAVQERADVPGWGPWSEKLGVPHVQPPSAVLDDMITLRLHLDRCTGDNGALRVLPGSHSAGRLSPEQIDECRRRIAPRTCEVECGGVMLMRPLLVHSSSAAKNPGHRRVLHVEFGGSPLPDGLRWYEQPSWRPTGDR